MVLTSIAWIRWHEVSAVWIIHLQAALAIATRESHLACHGPTLLAFLPTVMTAALSYYH